MLHPTIEELTQGKYNRYELALAAARCARLITDEYVRQHDMAERSQTGDKSTDRPVNQLIDRELRDEKAVKVAINRMNKGIYRIDLHAEEHPEDAEDLWEAGNEAEVRLEELAEERAERAARGEETDADEVEEAITDEIDDEDSDLVADGDGADSAETETEE